LRDKFSRKKINQNEELKAELASKDHMILMLERQLKEAKHEQQVK